MTNNADSFSTFHKEKMIKININYYYATYIYI